MSPVPVSRDFWADDENHVMGYFLALVLLGRNMWARDG